MTGFNTPALDLAEQLGMTKAELRDFRSDNPGLIRAGFGNLVTNGTFDSAANWINMSIGSGTATFTSGKVVLTRADAANLGHIRTEIKTVVGAKYLFKASVAVASAKCAVGSTVNQDNLINNAVSGGQTFSASAVALGTTTYQYFLALANNTEIDNASTWEADPSDDAPWLRMPYGYRVMQGGDLHPHAVVQRDNDLLFAADFTEIWRNGQCFIKPMVAPGVSTKFSIVGYRGV